MITILSILLFNGGLLYAYIKMNKKHPESISRLYYFEVSFLWRWSVIAVATSLAFHASFWMIIAGVSLLGVPIFPDIDNPKEKRIHDIHALVAYSAIALHTNILLIPILGILWWSLRKKLTLYSLEILGFNIMMVWLIIKTFI